MPQSIYGPVRPRVPGPVEPSPSPSSSPALGYMKKAIEILTNLSDAGSKGKDLAVERLDVLGQLIKLRIAAFKK